MSGKKAKAARKAGAGIATDEERAQLLADLEGRGRCDRVVAVVGASFVTPKWLERERSPVPAHEAMAMGADRGSGLPAGSLVPSFAERDLISGRTISSQVDPFGRKTLLFFSEGVMCQACFEQIRGLEQHGRRARAPRDRARLDHA